MILECCAFQCLKESNKNPGKGIIRKENDRPVTLRKKDAQIQNKILVNLIHQYAENIYTIWPSCLFPRNGSLFRYLKISHLRIKEKMIVSIDISQNILIEFNHVHNKLLTNWQKMGILQIE